MDGVLELLRIDEKTHRLSMFFGGEGGIAVTRETVPIPGFLLRMCRTASDQQ